MDEAEKDKLARKIVAAQVGFYIHTAVFALVIGILFAVNAYGSKVWWVQWPFIGWGLGLLLHAGLVFGRMPHRASAWRERRIAEVKKNL
jgi:hypothetical protein